MPDPRSLSVLGNMTQRPDWVNSFVDRPDELAAVAEQSLLSKIQDPQFMAKLNASGQLQDFAETFADLGVDISKYKPLAGYKQSSSMTDKIYNAATKLGDSDAFDFAKRALLTGPAALRGAWAQGAISKGSPMQAYKGAETEVANMWDTDPKTGKYLRSPLESYDTGFSGHYEHATGEKPTGYKKSLLGLGDFASEVIADPLIAGSGAIKTAKGLKNMASKIPSDMLSKGRVYQVNPYQKGGSMRLEMGGRKSKLNPFNPQRNVTSYQQPPGGGEWSKQGPFPQHKNALIDQIMDYLPKTKKTAPSPITAPYPTHMQMPGGKIGGLLNPKGGADLSRPINSPAPKSVGAGSEFKETVRSIGERQGVKTISKLWSGLKQQFSSPHRIFEKSKAGRHVVDSYELAERQTAKFMHEYAVDIGKATEKLNRTERAQVFNVLDGKLGWNQVTPKVNAAAKAYRLKTEELWEIGVREGIFDPATKEVNYAPRIFEPEALAEVAQIKSRELHQYIYTLRQTGQETKHLEIMLENLQTLTKELSGGNLFSTQQKAFAEIGELPFAKVRTTPKDASKLKEISYVEDIEQAYGAYVRGMARSMFKKPALKQAEKAFEGIEIDGKLEFLPKQHIEAAKTFLQDWAGSHKLTPFEKASGLIRGFEFARLLGINFRSAVVNLTQQINNMAGLGIKKTAESAGKMIFDSKAPRAVDDYFGSSGWKDAFMKSGLADEVRFQFVGSVVPRWLQKLNDALGFMFNRVEILNKGTAWVGSMEKFLKQGMSMEDALKHSYKNVRDWQFFYGKTGLPAAMRKPLQATVLQFWSFPIKQLELILNMSKRSVWAIKNKKMNDASLHFLSKWIALAMSGDLISQELLGLNLNNALGFGIDTKEIYKALQSMSEGDMEEMYLHVKRASEALDPRKGVPGLIPSGPGPALGHLEIFNDAKRKGWVKTMYSHLMPLQIQRFMDVQDATKTQDGDFMLRNRQTGMGKYKLSPADVFKRTFIGKPQSEFEQQRIVRESYEIQSGERRWLNDIRIAFQRRDRKNLSKHMKEGAKRGYNMKQLMGMLKYQAKMQDVPHSERLERKYRRYRR